MNVINQPQTIIRKKAGHIVPKELLETALRHCPTVSGFAVQDVTNGVKSLETGEHDTAITIDNLMKLNEMTKPYEAGFYLANITSKHDKGSVQPFTVIVRESDKPDDPGKNILSFFVEGDFPKYTKEGQTDEYNFAHEIIIPMIEDYFEAADGDIGKFTAKLHSPLFEKNLMAHVGHRAVFLFIPLEGEPIAFGNNDLGGQFEWGEASQVHGYGKEKAANPITKAVEAVKGSKFNFLKKAEPAKEEVRVDSDGKPLPDGVHAVPPKSATPHPDAGKDIPLPQTSTGRTKVEVTVPKQLQGDSRNAWIRLFTENNELPKNHQMKELKLWVFPEQVPFTQEAVSTKQEVKALAARMKGGTQAPLDMKGAHKELEKLEKAAPAAAQQVRSPGDFIPDMSDVEMTEQTGILASFVDRDKVPSAAEIQKLESTWPTYSEKMGIPSGDLLRYTVADFMKITKGHKPSVMVILEMRRNLMQMVSADKLKDLIGAAAVKKETAKHVEAKTILKPETAVKRNILGLKKAG